MKKNWISIIVKDNKCREFVCVCFFITCYTYPFVEVGQTQTNLLLLYRRSFGEGSGSINTQWHILSSTDKIKIDFTIRFHILWPKISNTNYNKLYFSLKWDLLAKRAMFFSLFFLFLGKVIIKLRTVEVSCMVLIIRMNQTHMNK